ncbi:hypothetical protein ACIRQQ_46405 [Streptomyces fuscichromogenes]|uniref:hypothetical protein n=1 Tax=Streptomyces fuscichromogenes TaxID=1324013 RepID=UPI00382705BE
MLWWSVYVEYDARVPDASHDTAADHLTGHHAAIGTTPNGNFSVRPSVEAPTVERATSDALAATDRALLAAHGRAAVVGVEVMTGEELDRRNNEPIPLPELAGQIMRTQRFQEHAPIVAELASGPVVLAFQVRKFAEVWDTLPGPKPDHRKDA